jgi:hypothetical protein
MKNVRIMTQPKMSPRDEIHTLDQVTKLDECKDHALAVGRFESGLYLCRDGKVYLGGKKVAQDTKFVEMKTAMEQAFHQKDAECINRYTGMAIEANFFKIGCGFLLALMIMSWFFWRRDGKRK